MIKSGIRAHIIGDHVAFDNRPQVEAAKESGIPFPAMSEIVVPLCLVKAVAESAPGVVADLDDEATVD